MQKSRFYQTIMHHKRKVKATTDFKPIPVVIDFTERLWTYPLWGSLLFPDQDPAAVRIDCDRETYERIISGFLQFIFLDGQPKFHIDTRLDYAEVWCRQRELVFLFEVVSKGPFSIGDPITGQHHEGHYITLGRFIEASSKPKSK